MDIKLESVQNLFFIIAFLVPGFIYNGVLSGFIPFRQNGEKFLIALRLLTSSAVNYALCSPLIYLLLTNGLFSHSLFGKSIVWFAILFIVPAILGITRSLIIQWQLATFIFRFLKLRAISPIPTGWDWIFSRTGPCFLLVTLQDGTEIAGFFGTESMASSDPQRKDLYIEKVFRIPENGDPWTETPGTLGMHIDGAQIAYIEFRE